jgi:hypothetical protein
MNMFQILSYIPAIKVNAPPELTYVLSNFLSAAQLKIPTQFIPDIIPQKIITYLKSCSIPLKLKDFGLDSVSFISNFYTQIATLSSYLIAYLGIILLCKLLPKGRFLFLRKIKADCEYNGAIRVGIETVMELSFTAAIDLAYVWPYNMV